MKEKKRSGAIWVSTVLYVLISLTILSIVLFSVQPIINKNRDKAILYQSEKILKDIDAIVEDVSENEGNLFSLDIKISRGNLIINSSSNSIIFELKDSYYQYSEENKTIKIGKINYLTKKLKDKYSVSMYLDYSNRYNLTYNGKEINKFLGEGEYKIYFENKNISSGQIDIRVK